MPNLDAPASKRLNGWYRDQKNNTIEMYHNGTKFAQGSSSTLTAAAAFVATTTIASTTTMTAGTGLTVTTGDAAITAGNARLGAISAFATTEPTSAIVFKQGTAFAGAITTSAGLMSNGTLLRKIIADGTVSDVQT